MNYADSRISIGILLLDFLNNKPFTNYVWNKLYNTNFRENEFSRNNFCKAHIAINIFVVFSVFNCKFSNDLESL